MAKKSKVTVETIKVFFVGLNIGNFGADLRLT